MKIGDLIQDIYNCDIGIIVSQGMNQYGNMLGILWASSGRVHVEGYLEVFDVYKIL